MDNELKKEIINCSRCALCMEVCPVYKVKQTETSVLRGKFLQLLGLIRGDLKYDKNIAYNLDLCLGCKKCKTACPSDIDAVKIFAKVKEENMTLFEKIFYGALMFKIKILFLKILYKVKYPIGRRYYKKTNSTKPNEKIAHFNGCATKAIGLKFSIPYKFEKENFSCCALPFFVKGRLDLYEKYKKRNIDLIKKYDKVVFDCATCFDTVKNYEGIGDELKNKLIYFTDFYKNENLKSDKKLKISFHKPCHLDNKTFEEIENILNNIENIQYERMEGFDECCGFGGDFFIRHPKTAISLSIKKAENILKLNPDIILTTCPTCLWSLKFGIKTKNMKIKAYDLADFLHNFILIKD